MSEVSLRLRPLRIDDEEAFLAGHRAMVEESDFSFALHYEDDMAWTDYLGRLDNMRRGLDLPDGLVPDTFLVADVDGTIIGRVSIRHELNDVLARQGGHIGYGVLAEHRRRGHAVEILRQALIIARGLGASPSLVCCDDDNIGSAIVIERCGGELDSVIDGDDGLLRRYWVR